MGGIITGGLVILALAVLMPLCAYIPKASLAGKTSLLDNAPNKYLFGSVIPKEKLCNKIRQNDFFFYKFLLFLAVIITAVIFSVEYEVLRPMWKSKSRF